MQCRVCCATLAREMRKTNRAKRAYTQSRKRPAESSSPVHCRATLTSSLLGRLFVSGEPSPDQTFPAATSAESTEDLSMELRPQIPPVRAVTITATPKQCRSAPEARHSKAQGGSPGQCFEEDSESRRDGTRLNETASTNTRPLTPSPPLWCSTPPR